MSTENFTHKISHSIAHVSFHTSRSAHASWTYPSSVLRRSKSKVLGPSGENAI
jgi:hypothetical protein